MAYLPLANLMHHKLRSTLSALGIGIGICMMTTLSGLSRGSLYEVADRWEAVNAELFAYPDIWQGSITALSGVGLPDSYAGLMERDNSQIVAHVVPVFLWQVRLAGQGQLAAGVDPRDFRVLTGGRGLVAGRLFDPENKFARWIEGKLLAPAEDAGTSADISPADLADRDHDGLEIVVDTRLAAAGGLSPGRVVRLAGYDFTVVGVVEAGGLSRLYMPRKTAQYLFGSGDITKSTLLFIQLRKGVAADLAARRLHRLGLDVAQISQFRHMLTRQFGIMFVYVDAVNAVAMVIAFLFIMITLYTMVLQRTREIAILKSSGASKAFIVRQVLAESMILTGVGTLAGIAMSFAAAAVIEARFPLLTVRITPHWVAVAIAVAVVGSLASAAYPAWRAARVDMVEALSWE